MICLSGDRVRLRPFRKDDFEGIRSWVNNPLVTSQLVDADLFAHEHSPRETMEFLQSSLVIDPQNIRLVIADMVSDRYLGQVAIFDFRPRGRRCQIDLVLADPDRYNQGFGSEAVRLLTNYVLDDLGQHFVEAHIVSTNHIAVACFKKCGYRPAPVSRPGLVLLETSSPASIHADVGL